jgi:hypothetical protein
MNLNINAIISFILSFCIACSPIAPRPSTSGLDFPSIGVPEPHQSLYNQVLDAPRDDQDAAANGPLFQYPDGSRIVGLREGGTAPFNGLLYNTIAAAATVEVPIGQLRICRANSITEQQVIARTALTDIANLRDSIEAHRTAYGLFINNRNTTIQQYETYSASLRTRVDTERYRLIGFTVGGIAVGAVVAGLVVGLVPRVSP